MKRKSLILVLVALFCLFFTGLTRVSAAEETVNISFADTSNREITTEGELHTWTQNGITVLHEQGSSTSKVNATYYDPIRFYASHKVTVKYSKNIVKVILNCDIADKATTEFTNSTVENGTYVIETEKIVITLTTPATELVISKFAKQLRVSSIDVVYSSEGTGETPEPEQPDTPVVPEQTNQVEKVNELFKEYHNEGTYVKNTTIHLNSAAVGELATHFHVENHLVRTTYYTPEALWMSQGAEGEGVAYSYYGSAANNGGVTYGVAQNALEVPETTNVVLSGAGKESMEAYYTTLADLKSNTAVWVEDGNGYSTTDSTILGWFLDFTAPCLYGSVFTANYFSYAKASVEEENDELVLKLWVTSENWGSIEGGVAGVNNVLSTARISYEKEYEVSIEKAIEIAKQAGDTYTSDKYILTGTVTGLYNTQYGNFYIKDEEGNQICVYGLYSEDGNTRYDAMSYKPVNGDIVTVYGILGTYSNNPQTKYAWLLDVIAHEHVYSEATCLAPATCEICQGTTGTILDHVDGDKDHICDDCEANNVGNHEDNGNGKCDYCGYEFATGEVVLTTYKADFNTVSKTNTSYTTVSTSNGWKSTNTAVFKGGTSNSSPTFKCIGTANDRGFALNGKTSAKGVLTSPTLSGTLYSISFGYANVFGESNGVDITINVKVDGAVVATKRLDNNSVTQYTAYSLEWTLDTPVDGPFTIEITNNSPSNSTSNKDRVVIYNLSWTVSE